MAGVIGLRLRGGQARIRVNVLAAAALAAVLLLAPASAQAAPGSLDPTFGNGGIVTTAFGNVAFGNVDEAHGVLLQPDGKIVAVGASSAAGRVAFALARYEPNGALDATFGTGGKVTLR
jgi:uncharacterized delta-60 repeat protein